MACLVQSAERSRRGAAMPSWLRSAKSTVEVARRIFTIKNARSNASHRQLEAQPFAVPWRAVHSGPAPATAWPSATGSTRVSAACRRENHSQDCSMHRTVADSARNARSAGVGEAVVRSRMLPQLQSSAIRLGNATDALFLRRPGPTSRMR
jgi:hypothetical protein